MKSIFQIPAPVRVLLAAAFGDVPTQVFGQWLYSLIQVFWRNPGILCCFINLFLGHGVTWIEARAATVEFFGEQDRAEA